MLVDKNVIEFLSNNLSDIMRISKEGKSYYTGLVCEASVIRWLLQWGDIESVQIAYKLLTNIHFIDSSKMNALVMNAVKKIPKEIRDKSVYTSMGQSFDSGALISHGYAKQCGLSEGDFIKRWVPLESLKENTSNSPVIMLDDNITSGTQLIQLFSEFLPKYNDEREHISTPCTDEQLLLFKCRKFYIAVAVILSDPWTKIRNFADDNGLNIEIFSGELDGSAYLNYGGRLWSSSEEAEFAYNVVSEISRSLLTAKGWPKGKLESRLCGYGNEPKLTVFYHNIPKSLPAPFWKVGLYNAKSWIPLFPERKEWRDFQSQFISSKSHYQEAVEKIIGSTNIHTKRINDLSLDGTSEKFVNSEAGVHQQPVTKDHLTVTEVIVKYEHDDTAILDFRMLNETNRPISINTVELTIIYYKEVYPKHAVPLMYLHPSQEYELDISHLRKGDTVAVSVSHHIPKGEADRFIINLSAVCWEN